MTAVPGRPDALLAGLRAAYDAHLSTQLDGAREVALLDFPHYDNVGDSAIWLGQVHALARLGVGVAYVAHKRNLRLRAVRRLPADVPVLISGGGNFGDLYPTHRRFRERVVAAFPERRVVQLPQTVHFASPREAERSAEVLRRHERLTVLVRDAESLRYCRDVLGLRAELCPDGAFGIEPAAVDRVAPEPTQPLLCLWRRDGEAAGADGGGADGAGVDGGGADGGVDWLGEGPNPLRRRVDRRVAVPSLVATGPRVRRHVADALTGLAEAEVTRGLRLLGRGEVVATDRLHAVVLATLLGRPNVAVENSYGKLGRVHAAWLRDSPLTRFAPTRRAAVEAAGALAAGTPPAPSAG